MKQDLNKLKSFSNTKQLKITTKLPACLKTENSKAFFFFKHFYSLFLTLKKSSHFKLQTYLSSVHM